jgi:hypothetical protein
MTENQHINAHTTAFQHNEFAHSIMAEGVHAYMLA